MKKKIKKITNTKLFIKKEKPDNKSTKVSNFTINNISNKSERDK